jgi:hypothetical protein
MTFDTKNEKSVSDARSRIDDTITDVYLVSSLDRNWIIGRPIIDFTIDGSFVIVDLGNP